MIINANLVVKGDILIVDSNGRRPCYMLVLEDITISPNPPGRVYYKLQELDIFFNRIGFVQSHTYLPDSPVEILYRKELGEGDIVYDQLGLSL